VLPLNVLQNGQSPSPESLPESPSIKHHCGLFGVWGHPDAVALTYLGLYAQQHRGQESAGICSLEAGRIKRRAGMGLVTEVFNPESLKELKAPTAIGHVRYSTTGSCSESNASPCWTLQPRPGAWPQRQPDQRALLRHEYEEHGAISHHQRHRGGRPSAGQAGTATSRTRSPTSDHLQGAYSLLFLFPDRMVAAAPVRLRPLVLGA